MLHTKSIGKKNIENIHLTTLYCESMCMVLLNRTSVFSINDFLYTFLQYFAVKFHVFYFLL